MTPKPPDWEAIARMWRDAYLALAKTAIPNAVELERQRLGQAL